MNQNWSHILLLLGLFSLSAILLLAISSSREYVFIRITHRVWFGRTIINPPPSRHLIITTAFNFAAKDLEIFLRSLRAYDPENQIDLIVFANKDGVDDAALDLYRRHQAILKYVKEDGKPIVMERFNWYHNLLEQVKRDHPTGYYDLVAFADSRDVAFQSNPFMVTKRILAGRRKSKKDFVIFSLEGYANGGMKIGSCRFNSGWIRCFGDDTLERVKDKIISCAGVTIGTLSGMLEYNRLMAETIQKTGCNDQGIHNWMLYDLFTRQPPSFDAIAMANGESPVLTVGYISTDELVTTNYTVRLRDSTIYQRPAVVHQFDRYATLQAHFDRLWKRNHSE